MKIVTKYNSIFFTSIKSNLTYIGEMFYGTIFMLVIMYIFINLWKAAFATNNMHVNMGYVETVWYLLITQAIIFSLNPAYITISEEVQSGSIAYTMNRPYNYLFYHFFNGLGDSVIRFIINLSTGSVLVISLVGSLQFKLFYVIPLVVIVFMSFLLNYCINALIGLSSFFIEEAEGVAFIYKKFLYLLGGVLIPLDFFPTTLKTIVHYLPFAFITFSPSKLFVHFDVHQYYQVFSGQLIWICLLTILLGIVFRIGRRKLTINGG